MEGRITISRTTSNFEPDSIRITISTERHHFVAMVKVNLEEFAQCITGLMVNCEYEVDK